jgi:uncharacterized protein YndB with AHSA1/START domain
MIAPLRLRDSLREPLITIFNCIIECEDLPYNIKVFGGVTHSIIRKQISIHAPVWKLWRAITEPLLMKRWMFDGELEIRFDLVEGSPITIKGKLHGAFVNKGEIVRVLPEKIFEYTQLSSLSRLEDKPENYTHISFELRAADAQSVLTARQSNFPGKASREHEDFYWNSALAVLRRMLENQDAV